MDNVVQTNTSGLNRIQSYSSVKARGSTSLKGDFNITEFSNLTLLNSTSSLGSLNCSSGSDTFCGVDPFGGGGGVSNCGQCPY